VAYVLNAGTKIHYYVEGNGSLLYYDTVALEALRTGTNMGTSLPFRPNRTETSSRDN
jgi:hypothetical protein